MQNKFLLGLITALVLGALVNVGLGYMKWGYYKRALAFLTDLPNYIKGTPSQNKPNQVDTDIKDCRDLIAGASSLGSLKVTVLGNGQPIGNLEVDVSNKPGPQRCMEKTDTAGSALFSDVPAGTMYVFFNQSDFPKEFGETSPTEAVEIVQNKTTEKVIELKRP